MIGFGLISCGHLNSAVLGLGRLTTYPKSQGGGRQEVPRVNFEIEQMKQMLPTRRNPCLAQITESFSPVFNHGSDITPVSLHLDMPCS